MNRYLPLLVLVLLGMGSPLSADTYTITLDPAARSEPATGRVLLFFITKTGWGWDFKDPMEAPFFEAPQPIASIAVKDFKPGDFVKIDGSVFAFPDSLDKLDGPVRVQAVLDCDHTERSFAEGSGNVHSDVASVTLSAMKDDQVTIALNHRIDGPPKHKDRDNLKWVEFRSEMLSKHYGRDVYHRAGVALPPGYNDPICLRKEWPAIYEIPGYGGRTESAEDYAEAMTIKGVEEFTPIAVYIVLDPESPLGHHGFVDSPANGPRETALIMEFIPYLESQFRLVAKPQARLITGHSSGGWTSLWLQLRNPEVFGGCWSSSPDPIDFSAFQMTNLYEDSNMFRQTDGSGGDTPSMREYASSDWDMKVTMTVRQESLMERAIDPSGGSGQQWDAWEAMFSPLDEKNPGAHTPKPMFNELTGAIDRDVVNESWSKYDITRMVTGDWKRYGPVVMNNVHLACGTEDSFYLNRAVEMFKQKVEELEGGDVDKSPGYVLMVEKTTHNITPKIFVRWNTEMREYLQKNGLQDADVVKPGK